MDSYWSEHTVSPVDLPPAKGWTRGMSERQLEWRFQQYPMFRELTGLWGDHDGQTVLDFGCGPGNDLVGFALHTGAERIIGIDVSDAALSLAADRLALHRIDPGRVELIQASDSDVEIPLPGDSVDHVQSQGVVHHMSDPDAALRELHRVLRPGGTGCVMVYNRDSVWFHLWVAYERMVARTATSPATASRRRSGAAPTARIARSRAATGARSSPRCAERRVPRPSTWAAISPVTSWSA